MTPGRKADASPNAATASGWRALSESLDGELLQSEAASFVNARRLFNQRFDSIRPAAIAFPTCAADVSELLGFARRHDVPIAIRSGGHSYAGWSSGNDRLVIDVGRMNRISVQSQQAAIGAGARLGEVYSTLSERGVTISAGTCPSVGISGLTLGGGHGLLSRAFGLTCDNLIEATIVTADGAVRTCSEDEERDLFWALRGAGNGNFGVVTDLRLRTHPVSSSTSAELLWPWPRAANVIAEWQEWAPDLPDEMWASILIQAQAGIPSVSVAAFSLGSEQDLVRQLGRLAGGLTHSEIRTEPHPDTMRRFAGADDGAETHPCYDVRSDFFARSLSAAAIDAAIAAVENAPADVDVQIAFVALGGEVNRRAVEETAFIHRGHRFLGQYEAHWKPDDDPVTPSQADGWLRTAHSAMQPHASGEAYQNVPDPRLAQWRRAYYGSASGRLERLKRRFDPDRLFEFPQAV